MECLVNLLNVIIINVVAYCITIRWFNQSSKPNTNRSRRT